MFDDDPGMEMEAIEQEKHDADMLQAQYEAESSVFWRRRRKSDELFAEGKLDEAAAVCPHGGGYPLDSLAAEYALDPRKGETGFRCGDCGSVLSAWYFEDPDFVVLHPCERWEVPECSAQPTP